MTALPLVDRPQGAADHWPLSQRMDIAPESGATTERHRRLVLQKARGGVLGRAARLCCALEAAGAGPREGSGASPTPGRALRPASGIAKLQPTKNLGCASKNAQIRLSEGRIFLQ